MATAVQLNDSRARPRRASHAPASTRGTSVAQGLGWFSIGLGLAQVAAPRSVARLVGIDENHANVTLMRALGIREMTAGVGILSQRKDDMWLLARVLGDAMDLALLTAAARAKGTDRTRALAAFGAVAGVMALDALTAARRARDHHDEEADEMGDDAPVISREEHGVRHVKKSITIHRSREEVRRVLADRPALATRLRDADVSLVPGPRGDTEVHVAISYEPGNPVRSLVRKAKREDPAQELQRELRHLKQVIETGDIVHSDASIHRGMHPAQPDREVSV